MEVEKKTKKCKKYINNFYIPPPARKADYINQQLSSHKECKGPPVLKIKRKEEKLLNKKKLLCKPKETAPDTHKIPSSHKDKLNVNSYSVCVDVENKSDCKESALSVLPLDSKVKSSVFNASIGNNALRSHENLCSVYHSETITENGICESENIEISAIMSEPVNDICNSFSNMFNLNESLKDVNDNHKKCSEREGHILTSVYNKHVYSSTLPDEGKSYSSSSGPINDKSCCDRENQVFRDVWEKLLYEYENLEIDPHVNKSRTVTKTNVMKVKESSWLKGITANCILEIYGFPETFKTSDLLSIFSSYVSRGFKLKWVDDTHALGIFTSQITAYEVLNTDLPSVKMRPLSHACPLSQEKASHLMPPPPPPRPKTCSALARRLVSGALGIRPVFTPAEIEAEREILKVAREQKILAAKQKEAT